MPPPKPSGRRPDRRAVDDLVTIDYNRLDAECRDQARRVWKYGVIAADARHAYKTAVSRFKLTEAEVRLAVALNPQHYRLEGKPSLPIIDATVVRHPKYQAAMAEMYQAKHDLEVFQAAHAALRERGEMLQRCVQMEAINYRTSLRNSRNPEVEAVMRELDQKETRRPVNGRT